MTLGTQIGSYRRKLNITQESLAQKLGVTNQAVSKWESDQCCPDVMLLPKIADVFEITLDALFGREPTPAAEFRQTLHTKLPWEDNDTLYAVLFIGHQLIQGHPACKDISFQYEGPALNIQSDFSISCDDVSGNVNAGGNVDCDEVHGNVNAGGNVNCDDVLGHVRAGGNVSCDDVTGNVTAGCDVSCDNVEGSICAGKNVTCE